MDQCEYSAQGKLVCNIQESFVNAPINYNIHVMVIYDNAIIFNQSYENISPSKGDYIAGIASRYDATNGINKVYVRITDNTFYEARPETPPLRLYIETKEKRFPVMFVGNLDYATTEGRVKRSVDFAIERYSGFKMLFNI